MNLLTKTTIYALYPNATFVGRGMWGVGDSNRSFERKANDAGLNPSFYSLCDGHCGNECEGSLRRLSDSSGICAVSLRAEKDKVTGLSKDDILMVLEWKLWPDCQLLLKMTTFYITWSKFRWMSRYLDSA